MENNSHQALTVTASYVQQKVLRYQGNPLIEALPTLLSDDQLAKALQIAPDFSPEQRKWETYERMFQTAGLTNFMVPLSQHIRLARTLDMMLREGYVSRAPRTREHIATFQKLYEQQQKGLTFAKASPLTQQQISTSLIGVSGMGKSTTVKRILSRIAPVIYHPELHIWQIPYLHIETPHDGASVIGLAHAIFRKIDSLIEDANYYQTYCTSRASAETLINRAAMVLHAHCVGILICDEIQNLENSPKNKQSLMSLLVSASNELGVPLLFIGTPKAQHILSLDFRQARRSSGIGMQYWDRLPRSGNFTKPDSWEDFISVLWSYQWTHNPQLINPHFSDLMYHHSQGIIDIAIKLFIASQLEAMLDMSETLTAQLINDVANSQLALVQPALDAIRTNNQQLLSKYGDVSSLLDINSIIKDAQFRYEGTRVRGASIHPDNMAFLPMLSGALEEIGVDPEQAEQLAEVIKSEGIVNNVIEGTKQALEMMAPMKRTQPKFKKDSKIIELLPGDYRLAIREAHKLGTKVHDQLVEMGMACDVEKVLGLA